MAPYGRERMTIAKLMTIVACMALLIAVLANPGALRTVSIIAGLIGGLCVVLAVMIAVFDLCIGVRCPNCGAWAMARVSVTSFRDRYFQCTACQARCRRGFLRGWGDASGSEFDHIYGRKRPENPWTAAPRLEDEDLIDSKTHVNLLINKKRRNPNPPDQYIPPV